MIKHSTHMPMKMPKTELSVELPRKTDCKDRKDEPFHSHLDCAKANKPGMRPVISQATGKVDEGRKVTTEPGSNRKETIEKVSEKHELLASTFSAFFESLNQPHFVSGPCRTMYISPHSANISASTVSDASVYSNAASVQQPTYSHVSSEISPVTVKLNARSQTKATEHLGLKRELLVPQKQNPEGGSLVSSKPDTHAPQLGIQSTRPNIPDSQDQPINQATGFLIAEAGIQDGANTPDDPVKFKSAVATSPASFNAAIHAIVTPKTMQVMIDDPELGKLAVRFGRSDEKISMSLTTPEDELPLAVAEVHREMRIWLDRTNAHIENDGRTIDGGFQRNNGSDEFPADPRHESREPNTGSPRRKQPGTFSNGEMLEIRPGDIAGSTGKWRLI